MDSYKMETPDVVGEDSTVARETQPMLPMKSKETPHSATLGGSTAQIAEGAMVSIQRNAYSQGSLMDRYGLKRPPDVPLTDQMKTCCRSTCCQCSADRVKRSMLSLFPFINMLRTYQWRHWLLYDVVAGLSVGVIHIPQGMGFALLTNVPPVYGLYSSFFPLLIYFIFGTSRHISVGTMAVVSLMIGSIVASETENLGLTTNGEAPHRDPNTTIGQMNATGNNVTQEVDITQVKVGIAMSVSLLVGVYQVIMAVFRLGIIATFMSMAFVGSFLVGAAVHIITSQVPAMFSLKLPPHPGVFKVPLTYYEFFRHIAETNVATLIIGIICIIFLVVMKEIINVKYRHKLKVPIPAELIVLVLATIISHFAQLHDRFDVRVIGDIPRGIPAPVLPPMTNVQNYAGSAVAIAVVSFTVSITMAKLMAHKHQYTIDTNQEMLAYGLMNGVGAFFNSFAGCQAPPRTLVHDSTGGKTQVGSLVSCVLILLVCLAMGPLFYNLPNSVLAAIIICALLPLFRQFKDLKMLWAVNKYDWFVWVCTFLSCVIFSIPLGLGVGIGVSIFMVVLQGHLAKGTILSKLGQTELYAPSVYYTDTKASTIPGIRIFHFGSSLFFANIDKFKQQLFEAAVNPMVLRERDTVVDVKGAADLNANAQHPVEEGPMKGETEEDMTPASLDAKNPEVKEKNSVVLINGTLHENDEDLAAIIIDCGSFGYIDMMGLNALKSLSAEYRDEGVRMVLADCGAAMVRQMDAAGMQNIDVFPSIQDAVTAVTTEDNSTVL